MRFNFTKSLNVRRSNEFDTLVERIESEWNRAFGEQRRHFLFADTENFLSVSDF